MLSCYRASEATDPESFIAEATSVFARYPEEVARRVSYAMPSESKWLPSIAEIRDACDKADAPRLAEQRRAAERARTAAIIGSSSSESLETRKRVADQMRARFSELGAEPGRPQPVTKSPERLAEEFSSKGPLTFSPLLRRALGITAEAAE